MWNYNTNIDFLICGSLFEGAIHFLKSRASSLDPFQQKSRTPISFRTPVILLKDRERVLRREVGKLYNNCHAEIEFLFFAAVSCFAQNHFWKIRASGLDPSQQKSRTPISFRTPVLLLKDRERVLGREVGKLYKNRIIKAKWNSDIRASCFHF